jgi:hypothetical protein
MKLSDKVGFGKELKQKILKLRNIWRERERDLENNYKGKCRNERRRRKT